jgi:two-component system, sensor histidine kinase and response regulator
MTPEIQVPVLEHATAMARVGGDAELLKELAGLFVEEYPQLLTELQAALADGDARRVEHAAHALKGAVANFGAQQAVDTALQLEQLGRIGRLEPAADLLRALDLVLMALHAELVRL